MESEVPPPTIPSIAISARLRQQQLLHRDQVSRRSPTAQQAARLQRDVQARRSPPRLARTVEKPGAASGSSSAVPNAQLSPGGSATPRSLIPNNKRTSHEELLGQGARRTGQDDEKLDIAPDGGSGGREGRQFTVANVGNNGRIYLRPTVRPANQRYAQPHFAFPVTRPSTAGLGLDALGVGTREDLGDSAIYEDSQWTPSHDPSTPNLMRRDFFGGGTTRPSHRRAMSDSTIPDTSIARESDPGGFKIVITQPGDGQRPKTVEDLEPGPTTPLIDISIPSWKIGTPRFSMRGTAFIRGSSCVPTEDNRSSSASVLNRSQHDMTPDATRKPSPSPIAIPPMQRRPPSSLLSPTSIASPRLVHPLRATCMSTHLVIEPGMFDALTLKPACDDRAIVRYNHTTKAVTAATPPRLVAEITSPSFLDYELLSDFFLTFRSFLEASDLLRMLIARLRWALARDDEVGLVVRVRTFVALRHWILNYFVDDFVVDYPLRITFCELLNDFVDELSQDARGRKVQLKILAELKKCWRRVCGQYWDGPDFDASLGPDVPISPGGIAGHRDPNLDPTFWEKADFGPPQLDGFLVPTAYREQTSFYADVSRAGHIDSVIVGDRPGTPEDDLNEIFVGRQTSPTSPTSRASIDVLSCSFPSKHLRYPHPGASNPLAAHPVDPSSIYMSVDPVATTPRALSGKRVRPPPTHNRNGSLTDSLREHSSVTEKVLFKNAEFLLTLPYAGSLVRGNLFPPTQPFVEVATPGDNGGTSRETTIFQPTPAVDAPKEKMGGSAMSGQGMRKLLGGVRRALSNKGQVVSPTQGNFINISPIGLRGATTNRLPGTAIVPQARPHQNGARPPVRIDLLGAEVAEDFKKAVREDAALDAERYGYLSPPAAGSRVPGDMLDYSAAHMDNTFEGADLRPGSEDGISEGSKSIVIVDGTIPEDVPSMAGAIPLPAVNPSVENFADAFLTNAIDPTPPTTPPGHPMGTPRRSSYILSQHVLRPSLSADPLPPLISDMVSTGTPRPSQDTGRPSFDDFAQTRRGPPLSGVRGHVRYRSSRSYRSLRSLAHRRHASYTSGMTPHATVRSFDATTYSGASVDDSIDVPLPQPLRVLRRRPGGDLRAVTNAGQLDHGGLRRSRSVGSLTTFSESVRSSFIRSPANDASGFVNVVDSDYSPRQAEMFSLGAMTEQKPKRTHISLFSTHSSKPIMRPSFELEAQKLAQIPDDDDDGGVESALLKLEGKFEKRSARPSSLPIPRPAEAEGMGAIFGGDDGPVTVEEKREHRHVHMGDEHAAPSSPTVPAAAVVSLRVPSHQRQTQDGKSFLSEDSMLSYSSIPLLERGITDDIRGKRPKPQQWANHSILRGPDEGTPLDGQSTHDSQHPSYEFVKKTDSMEEIKDGTSKTAAKARMTGTEQSFLDDESDGDSDDDSDDGSDLSSELSDARSSHSEEGNQATALAQLPVHPLGEDLSRPPAALRPNLNPPSPPMTVVAGAQISPKAGRVPLLHDHQLWDEKPLPPTPDTTPTIAAAPYGQCAPSLASPKDPTGTKEALRNAPKIDVADPVPSSPDATRSQFSVHLPFILAFDSEVLAQQFTLIEKDALNEIDWKELIEMRWKNADHNGINARSWVSFLRDTDARGVEVVIARFNLMVKWAVSEIVLTQDMEERARCIIKYIHIAAHCRRYRNFATMSQLAIALTSNEVSRLAKTWMLVPAADVRTLQDLESLISPTRNFWNLRAEMEGGGIPGASTADMGCIPFVGIYTHDLLFNAQRPSEIASSPTGPPLVNFERCRIAASVIKTLLRLLEASTFYEFQPIEGITERCLWMGALTDEEIRRNSESLE